MAPPRVAQKRKRTNYTTVGAKKSKKNQAAPVPAALTPGSYDQSKLWEFKTPAWYEEGPRSQEQFGPLFSYREHAAIIRRSLHALVAEKERLDGAYYAALKAVEGVEAKLEAHGWRKQRMKTANWDRENRKLLKKLGQDEASVERLRAQAYRRRLLLSEDEEESKKVGDRW